MPHPIVQEEESLLARVRERLAERLPAEGAREDQLLAELERLRGEISNTRSDDLAAAFQQFEHIHALVDQLRKGRPQGEVDPDSPYFAHLRLKEEGRSRDLFLGKASRTDSGLRIIDWRNAPIAQLFYRYQEGEEYSEELGGRLQEGVVEARRTVTVERGFLRRISCPQGIFVRQPEGWKVLDHEAPQLAGGQGASILRHETATGAPRRLDATMEGHRRADKHLPDIAALIDPAQFELISSADSGLVVIRGIAGSGKTTVALHRVAWLHYQDPERFRGDKMLVVVWGRALRDYISKVLPSLGVPDVPVVTWSAWAKEQVRRHFPFLPKAIAEDTPEIVSRLKLHPGFMGMLEKQVARTTSAPSAHGVWEDFNGLFMDLHWLLDGMADLAPGAFTVSELERAWDWMRRQRGNIQDWMEGEEQKEVAELDAEDYPLLLRLWQMRVGKLRREIKKPIAFSHLVVDEVQDLSPLEVAVLLDCLDDKRCGTLSGDTQQHIIEQAGFTDWRDFLRRIGAPSTAVETLRVSYRSTHEITSFARHILGPLAEDHVAPQTTRPGAPVELFPFPDHGAAVAMLGEALVELARREPLASVALLTPNPGISRLYYEGLEKCAVPRLRLVEDQKFAFAPGVEVTEVSEVKGLEFDYVVLVEVSVNAWPDNSHSRRMLHVGATRAAHQLWLTCVGEPSPIVL